MHVQGLAEWDTNGEGMNLPGVEVKEILCHAEFAAEKCSAFQGREKLVYQLMDMIMVRPNRIKEDSKVDVNFEALTVSIVGAPGSGKSSLIAKLGRYIYYIILYYSIYIMIYYIISYIYAICFKISSYLLREGVRIVQRQTSHIQVLWYLAIKFDWTGPRAEHINTNTNDVWS